MTRTALLLPLLLAACAADDAQPDRPEAWRVSGDLVETAGAGCVWEDGDSIDLELNCMGVDLDLAECPDNGTDSPDERLFCGDPMDAGDTWEIGCSVVYDDQADEDGSLDLSISKATGAGTLTWAYEGCTWTFDVTVTDL